MSAKINVCFCYRESLAMPYKPSMMPSTFQVSLSPTRVAAYRLLSGRDTELSDIVDVVYYARQIGQARKLWA